MPPKSLQKLPDTIRQAFIVMWIKSSSHYFVLSEPQAIRYKQTAAYGHLGRTDIDLPWEKTDKAEILRKEALGQ